MLKKMLKMRELIAVVFIIALFLGVGALNPAFLSVNNIMLCLNSSVVYTIIAVGISMVIMTGEIDVSVGAVMGISAAITGTMIRDGAPWPLAIGCALLAGAAIGLVNGIGVNVIGVPSIIMTLGVNSIVRGLIYVYSGGAWIENLPYDFKATSQMKLGSITWFYLGVLCLTVLIHLFLTRTKHGRYVKAVGDNAGGATLLGIPVTGTKIATFVACAVCAAIGGVMYAARVGFITPTAGAGYDMKVIASCVLGGISLTGGVGSVIGAALGAIIMASISRMLIFVGLSSDYDDTITGLLLITIVVADALMHRHAMEKARRERLAAKTASVAKEV